MTARKKTLMKRSQMRGKDTGWTAYYWYCIVYILLIHIWLCAYISKYLWRWPFRRIRWVPKCRERHRLGCHYNHFHINPLMLLIYAYTLLCLYAYISRYPWPWPLTKRSRKCRGKYRLGVHNNMSLIFMLKLLIHAYTCL